MNKNDFLALLSTMTIVLLLMAAILSSSCRSQVVVATQVHDSVRVVERVRVDSVYRDRWHAEYVNGDTVHVLDSIIVDKWHFATRVDSVAVIDSIPYPVEVVKEVRKRNGYDRFVSLGFWFIIGLAAASFAWRLLRKFYICK